MNSLLLKGKAGYFPNWHEVQSKLSLDTEPNGPLEVNCCTREDGAWPRRECQSAKDGKEETAEQNPFFDLEELGQKLGYILGKSDFHRREANERFS